MVLYMLKKYVCVQSSVAMDIYTSTTLFLNNTKVANVRGQDQLALIVLLLKDIWELHPPERHHIGKLHAL